MTGPFYGDLMPPFMSIDIPAVTMLTTDLPLYPTASFPILGGNYFGFIGRQILIKMFGRMTTGTTPGNLTWDVYWGSGAAATGTIIQSSAAVALVASGVTIPWEAEFLVRCTAIGSSGALFCTGKCWFPPTLMLSTVQPMFIPATAPATSASIDLSASNIVSVQAKRSGSTAETMQVHQLDVFALN